MNRLKAYALPISIGAAIAGFINILMLAMDSIEKLTFLRTLQGISWTLIAPTGATMASISTTRNLRGRAMGLFNLSESSGFLAGSIVGGMVSQLYGLETVFIVGSIASILSSITALSLRGWGSTSRIETFARKDRVELKKVEVVYIGFILRNIAATGIWALLPIFLVYLGASRLWVGILCMVNLASQTLLMGYVGALTDRLGRKPVFLLGLFGSSIVFILYGVAQNYLWIVPIHVLLGLSWCSLINSATAYVGDHSPRGLHGATMSLLFTATGLAWIIGSSLAAATVEVLGLRNYVFLAAAISTLGGLYSALKMKSD